MIIVEFFTFLKWNFIVSFIIEIMAENGYGIAELFLYFLNKGALAGAGTPCNSYYNYVFHIALLFILAKNASAAGCCHKQIFSKELNMAPVGVLSEPFDRARLYSRRKRAKTLVIKLHRSSTNGARLQFYPKSARGLAMNCEGDG